MDLERYYADKYDLDKYRSSPKAADSDAARGSARSKSRKPRYAEPARGNGRNISSSSKPSRRRPPKTKMPKGKKAVVALVSVIIIGAIAATACIVVTEIFSDYKKSQPFQFSDNVKIGGINVGGMSYKDAKKKLKDNLMFIVHNYKIEITANGEELKLSKNDFEYTFDLKTALDSAKIYSLKEQDIYEEPDETEKVTEATAATEKTEDFVNFKVEYDIKEKSVEDAVQKFSKVIDAEPVNAEITSFHPFSGKRFSYKKGSVGYMLHQDELSQEIVEFIRSGEASTKIEATVETLEPEITVADLQNNIVGLATATSTSYNNANANTNMAVALKACNGSIIKPGEIWSFNSCTGDSNLESNGYKKATVIVEGKYEEGVGGGICQASTTIFNAALFANTAIIERNNHFWASDYAYAGEDATIDYPSLDLRFQNTTNYPMFLECKMEGAVLTANIWGVQEDYYDNIKVYTENYDIQKKKEYKTVTKRVLYKDGEVVREEEICYSFYSLTDGHSLRQEDSGTFRTSVSGEVKEEAKPKKKKKQNQ